MKRRKVRILASALALALTVSMSGCTVSINMENKNKKETETTETAETKEETTKETKKAKEETKKADPTATPIPEPTATPVPQSVEQTASAASQQGTAEIQYTTMYVMNCETDISLRPQPDVNSGRICTIPYGKAVSYIETAQNGFLKINYDGREGYALASYLSTEKPPERTTTTSAAVTSSQPSTSYDTYYVKYCNTSISLRVSPSTSAEAPWQIPLGASVSFLGVSENGFYHISYNDNEGYALASYLVSSTGSAPYKICQVVKCDEDITLRQEASANSGAITTIDKGERVSYVKDAGFDSQGYPFYEIYYMGQHGYARADYLQFVD
nr:SH3 domain-containing protein [uncultured Blautia sp.]